MFGFARRQSPVDLDLLSLSSPLPRDSILLFWGTLASLHKSSVVAVPKTSVLPLSICPGIDRPRDRKNEVMPQEHLPVPRKYVASVKSYLGQILWYHVPPPTLHD